MEKKYAPIFGAIIVIILLILYTGTILHIIFKVISSVELDPTNPKPIELSDSLIYVVNTLGGLISALVVAKLAITLPKENPGMVPFTMRDDGTQSGWVTFFVWCYLAIWLLVGLAAFIWGVMAYPKISHTLNDIGTTWFGLAVAAGYAYFGITPKEK